MWVKLAAVLLPLAAILAGASADAGTLEQVRGRGQLRCGINPGLAGFGRPDAQGVFRGLNADFCRAVAAAIFDDSAKVSFIPLTAKDRLTALQSGEIDLLSHNTTWTMTRDAQVQFPAILFYDGQGFMVRRSKAISSARELGGATICAQQGSTTELNLADYFRKHGLRYEGVSFGSNDEALAAYQAGRCDALTTDVTSLYAERSKLPDAADHVVLPEVIAKEPLGPAVRRGDDDWAFVVRWTLYGLLEAEELGLTQANVSERKSSSDPALLRLLGVGQGDGGSKILPPDWAYRVVRHVGNYGEIFERNLGSGSPLGIRRGLNDLWSRGGLHYAAPIR